LCSAVLVSAVYYLLLIYICYELMPLPDSPSLENPSERTLFRAVAQSNYIYRLFSKYV